MKRAFAAICLAIAILPCRAATDDEVEKEGTLLIQKGDWAGFNIAATRYLRSKERTSAGFSSLQMLYSGVFEACPNIPTDPAWDTLEGTTEKWLVEHGSFSPAIVAAAIVRLKHGHQWRGGSSFNKIPADRLDLFKKSVESARTILDSHADAGSRDPGWYSQKIYAEMLLGQDKNLVLKLVDRGLDLDSHYMAIHFMANNALSQRWGGAPGDMSRLFAVARSHEDGKDGAYWYARMAYVNARSDGWEKTREIGFDWPQVQRSFDAIVSAYPDPWNLNNYAAMACLVGDKPRLQELLAKLGSQVDPKGWFRRPEFLAECRASATRKADPPPASSDPERLAQALHFSVAAATMVGSDGCSRIQRPCGLRFQMQSVPSP